MKTHTVGIIGVQPSRTCKLLVRKYGALALHTDIAAKSQLELRSLS